jgi:hypothetical protein
MNETVITVQITVQIHCWARKPFAAEDPRYRLYIDNDLITERTWDWDNWGMQTYIEENLCVELDKGVNHTVRLELIKDEDIDSTPYSLQNLTVNGESYPDDHGGYRSELSFMLA